jgi:hypothetical protein
MESPGDDRRRFQRKRRILDRVVALRRPGPVSPDEPAERTADEGSGAEADEGSRAAITALEARVNHLEAAFEGLQDAVYRDAQRQERELAELRRDIQPENMARSLSGHARRHGL